MYVEKDCTIEHEDYLVAYMPSVEGPERVGAVYPLHSWRGDVIGSVTITGRWRIPGGVLSLHMVSGRATVDGRHYNVRGCGFGMLIRGRRA